ncbi:hypothetical protein MXM41_11530 [Leclercia adecarboxylata]|uniref:hypothetical protein n=1 Tax=Leclercia adecarboxylata TaxID=83655 RepID=UPI002DBF3CFE|nr:hypothetical protein [Leclercia adecarboxylata]MEB6379556.1 hypothetical protein [Leclercia adecarboxylata]
MKELNVFEMEQIAAGVQDNIFTRIAAAALGAATWGVWGTLIGGTQSGANGGLLGFGGFGNLVGMFWGLATGAIGGGLSAFAQGWDKTVALTEKTFNNLLDGQFVPWSQ